MSKLRFECTGKSFRDTFFREKLQSFFRFQIPKFWSRCQSFEKFFTGLLKLDSTHPADSSEDKTFLKIKQNIFSLSIFLEKFHGFLGEEKQSEKSKSWNLMHWVLRNNSQKTMLFKKVFSTNVALTFNGKLAGKVGNFSSAQFSILRSTCPDEKFEDFFPKNVQFRKYFWKFGQKLRTIDKYLSILITYVKTALYVSSENFWGQIIRKKNAFVSTSSFTFFDQRVTSFQGKKLVGSQKCTPSVLRTILRKYKQVSCEKKASGQTLFWKKEELFSPFDLSSKTSRIRSGQQNEASNIFRQKWFPAIVVGPFAKMQKYFSRALNGAAVQSSFPEECSRVKLLWKK